MIDERIQFSPCTYEGPKIVAVQMEVSFCFPQYLQKLPKYEISHRDLQYSCVCTSQSTVALDRFNSTLARKKNHKFELCNGKPYSVFSGKLEKCKMKNMTFFI